MIDDAAKTKALDLIADGRRFLVTCHRRPDADALGSALGFAAILRDLGRQVVVWVPEDIAENLRFLPGEIARTLPAGTYDSTWVMDTASAALLPRGLPPEQVRGPLVIVDHHACHDDVGDVIVRDVEACATGEVIMELAAALGRRPIPPPAAVPLYAAIVADTGGFRYAQTSARVMRLGAELLEQGADAWETAYQLFEAWRPERLKLLSAVLDTLELDCDGKLAILRVTREMLQRTGANDEMVEGLVNYGRMLRGVEVAVLLWEFPGDSGAIETKVSFRSRGQVDVGCLASELGGGGHRSAAGTQLAEPIDEVEARTRAKVRALLS